MVLASVADRENVTVVSANSSLFLNKPLEKKVTARTKTFFFFCFEKKNPSTPTLEIEK